MKEMNGHLDESAITYTNALFIIFIKVTRVRMIA